MDRIIIRRHVRHRFQRGEDVEVVTLNPGEVFDVGRGPLEIPEARARMFISQNQAEEYVGPVEPEEGEFSELSAEDGIELAEEADDFQKVQRWLREELEDKDRVTVVEALETRGDELFLELTLPRAEDLGVANDLFQAAAERGIDVTALEPGDGETVRISDLVTALEAAGDPEDDDTPEETGDREDDEDTADEDDAEAEDES